MKIVLSGGQWVTHREWVASVCLGHFTLFRQALQECPTIRPFGSSSTDLLCCHWLIWRAAVWKHRLLQFTFPMQLPTTVICCLPHHKTDTVTHSNRTTLAEPHHYKNNFNFATQWEAVRMRRPWFLGNRHDRYVRDATFSTKESICLVTLVLCGSWWQEYFSIKSTICIKTLRIIILTDEINFELHTTKQNIHIYTPKWKVVLLWITLSPNRWQSFSLRRSHTWTNSSWHKLFTWGGDVRTIISDRQCVVFILHCYEPLQRPGACMSSTLPACLSSYDILCKLKHVVVPWC